MADAGKNDTDEGADDAEEKEGRRSKSLLLLDDKGDWSLDVATEPDALAAAERRSRRDMGESSACGHGRDMRHAVHLALRHAHEGWRKFLK